MTRGERARRIHTTALGVADAAHHALGAASEVLDGHADEGLDLRVEESLGLGLTHDELEVGGLGEAAWPHPAERGHGFAQAALVCGDHDLALTLSYVETNLVC